MKIKVSIVIPVYNCEEYLEKCVHSLLCQTLSDIQIILVDDGSKDKSGEICDNFSSKDSRILVIHKENGGVSSARNIGISKAIGEYIGFVDADDWVDKNMFESLYAEAKMRNADIVMCDALTEYDNGKHELDTITQLSTDKVLQKQDFYPKLLLEMAGSTWRCIYKNDFIKKNKIQFNPKLKFSEDRLFNIYAMGYANKVVYLKKALYHRFMQSESAVHKFHYDYFEAYKIASHCIEEAILCAWEDNNELKKKYLGQFIGGAMGAICNYYYKTSPLTNREKKDMVKRLCDDIQLRTAIKVYGTDKKSILILKKNYSLLILYARLANFKHRR